MRIRRYGWLMLLAGCWGAQGQQNTGVSMRVSTETVPAGGVAQVKVSMTEPKPIVRTSLMESFEDSYFDSFLGIAGGGGLAGVAQLRRGGLRLELSAASALLLDSDYPILTLAVKTRETLAEGRSTPVALDLSRSNWISPEGFAYEEEAKPGAVITGGTFYVSDVLPGGGTIPARRQFRVLGSGFREGMKVRAEGAKLVSITTNEVVMEAMVPMRLDGLRIRVEQGKDRKEYFSYLRGKRVNESAHAALRDMTPVFSANAAHMALAPVTSNGAVNAIGVQNPAGDAIEVVFTAESLFGATLQQAALHLGAREYVFRTVEEIFGSGMPVGTVALRATSRGAFQLIAAQVSADGEEIAVPAVITVVSAEY